MLDEGTCACSDEYDNHYRHAEGTVEHLLLDCPLLKQQRREAYGGIPPHNLTKALYGKRLPETIEFLETTNAGRNPMHRETTYDYDVERQRRQTKTLIFKNCWRKVCGGRGEETPGGLAFTQASGVEMARHNEVTVSIRYYENNHWRS